MSADILVDGNETVAELLTEKTTKETILSIIRELSYEDQIDLINNLYETIWTDVRNQQQKAALEHKRLDEAILRFRFKVTQA